MEVSHSRELALVVTPHPVSLQGQRRLEAPCAALQPGETLVTFLARHGVEPGQQWVVSLGGVVVPESHWARVRPKHGHLIEARRVPEKSVLRLVAIAALAYFTLGAGGIGGGAFLGFSGAAGKILAYGAFLAGSLVINKLLAPKVPGRAEFSTNPTYSLSAGGRNRARLFEPMALVLGEPYAVPDLAAQPYTYFASGEQYLWQIFHLGLNCADVGSLRIGQTDLALYQGVTVLRNGLASGNAAFPALGTSVDTVSGALLTAPSGTGPWVTRVSSAATVRLAIDLVAQLFSLNNDGGITSRSTLVQVEYREVGSGTWLPFTDAIAEVPAVTQEVQIGQRIELGTYTRVLVPGVPAVPAGQLRLSNAAQKPLRMTIERAVPAGQYEVRLRKLDVDYSGTQGSNQVEWSQLRSFQQDLASYSGQARLAVQIQATGQLNGALDELNAILRAKPMPVWNGTAWVTAVDRATGLCNPGALFLLLARGIFDENGRRLAGLGYSDSQIDIEGLQRFMVRCAARGFQFDLHVQETMSLQDLLDAIAYAGLGEVAWPDGKIGVVFFSEDDPIEGVINMASIKARTFAVDYETAPTADEIEFQYFDRARGNTWKSLRVTAPGVTNPRATARVPLTGVTGEAHAAVLARFSMAQNVYQRKSVTFEQDLEYMTLRRGARVALSHDLTQWGYSGRLHSAADVAGQIQLSLDEPVPATNPTGGSSLRFIGLRLPGERQLRVFSVASVAGDGRTVTLADAWPVGVPLPGHAADNPAHDTLWIYDFKAVPGQTLRVAAIEPSATGARVTLVPESAEFWDYTFTGAYTPPPNTSLLRPPPLIDDVLVSEELARQGNTFYTELTISFGVRGAFLRAELWGAVGQGDNQPELVRLATSTSQALSWRGGLDERWHLELRVFSEIHQAEPFRLIYDVVGLRAAPPAFDVFSVLAQPDGTRQINFGYTTTPAPADWLGAEIRYLVGSHTTPAWESMVPLQVERTHYTASPIEVNQLLSGVHTFAARSIDTSGNASALRYFQLDLPPRRLGNVVAEFDELSDGWPGQLSGCEVNTATGSIEASSTTSWSALTSWDAWTRWSQSAVSPISYVSPVRDMTSVLTFLVDVQATVAGVPTIEVRSSETSADPAANPAEWTAWGPADARVSGRYLQVRVSVASSGAAPVAGISAVSYVVSAPLTTEYLNDVAIASLGAPHRIAVGDVRIPLANTYGTLLELQVVIQDASAGAWTWQLMDKNLSLGPRVRFRLNGTLADPALVDFIVKGF